MTTWSWSPGWLSAWSTYSRAASRPAGDAGGSKRKRPGRRRRPGRVESVASRRAVGWLEFGEPQHHVLLRSDHRLRDNLNHRWRARLITDRGDGRQHHEGGHVGRGDGRNCGSCGLPVSTCVEMVRPLTPAGNVGGSVQVMLVGLSGVTVMLVPAMLTATGKRPNCFPTMVSVPPGATQCGVMRLIHGWPVDTSRRLRRSTGRLGGEALRPGSPSTTPAWYATESRYGAATNTDQTFERSSSVSSSGVSVTRGIWPAGRTRSGWRICGDGAGDVSGVSSGCAVQCPGRSTEQTVRLELACRRQRK